MRILPGNVATNIRTYYLRHDRLLLQAMPACAQYDPGLFYTLRPGSCRFRAREFDVQIDINSLGVRDDEASLRAPDIVVLGDSYAMGWGVAQHETFADRLEALTGLRVLNAGVPSYGTAREMRMLGRIDTSRMRTLVIQYADNDLIENLAYRDAGERLEIGSLERYQRDLQRNAGRHHYYFGMTTISIVREAVWPRKSERLWLPPEKEARLFLETVVAAAPMDLTGVQVIVLEISPIGRMDGRFAAALAAEAVEPIYPEPIRRMKVLDLRTRLSRDDYFDLDDHLRASGHAAVAQALRDAILAKSSPRTRAD